MNIQLPSFLKPSAKIEKEEDTMFDHTHDWSLVAKTFVEPKPIAVADNHALTQLSITGMTTYLFQCSECKAFHKEEVAGVETTALDRIIDKVDISGPEYLLKDGKTYIVMRYQKNEQQGLPVR